MTREEALWDLAIEVTDAVELHQRRRAIRALREFERATLERAAKAVDAEAEELAESVKDAEGTKLETSIHLMRGTALTCAGRIRSLMEEV